MTKIIAALLILLPVAALADPYTDDKNTKVVQDAQALCKASRCDVHSDCGTFSYVGNEVRYSSSYCEEKYRRAQEDRAIRTKYGKK
jgi:hypothetical protein